MRQCNKKLGDRREPRVQQDNSFHPDQFISRHQGRRETKRMILCMGFGLGRKSTIRFIHFAAVHSFRGKP
jgi:hypothetical protein